MKRLTKSLFVTGMCCQDLMWYVAHEPDYLPGPDVSAQRRMRLGREAGELARDRWPDGTLLSGSSEAMATRTQELLSGDAVLFEATFMHERLLCKVDVLRVFDDGVDLIEVKSSSRVKDEHLLDVAFQKYVLSKCGVSVRNAYVMHINTEYFRDGELDLEQLFTLEDVTGRIGPLLETMDEDVERLLEVLDGSRPSVLPGKHCADTRCALALKLNGELPDQNVTQLYRSNGQKFLDDGITLIAEIPDGIGLNKKQLIQYEATKNGKVHVDKKKLSAWLDGLEYPLIHFDFETIDYAVPRWDGTRAYLQVPFQYSMHIEHADGTLEHKQFLYARGDDPRPHLLEQLSSDMPSKGTVLAHYASFEKSRLNELKKAFPEFGELVDKILARVDDLIIPFQKFWYYDPAQKGSCSIKALLPALVGHTFDGMAVSNGTEAQIAYEKMLEAFDDSLEKEMLAYCEQDTKSMVDILTVLRRACS